MKKTETILYVDDVEKFIELLNFQINIFEQQKKIFASNKIKELNEIKARANQRIKNIKDKCKKLILAKNKYHNLSVEIHSCDDCINIFDDFNFKINCQPTIEQTKDLGIYFNTYFDHTKYEYSLFFGFVDHDCNVEFQSIKCATLKVIESKNLDEIKILKDFSGLDLNEENTNIFYDNIFFQNRECDGLRLINSKYLPQSVKDKMMFEK